MRWRIGIILSISAAVAPQFAATAQIAEVAKAQAADPLAPYIKASGWVSTAKGPALVELILDEKNAGIRVRSPTNANPQVQVLTAPNDVLTLLADKRMQFLWPALTDWAGPTLEKMRDRTLAQLRAAAAAGEPNLPASTTSQSTSRPKIRALLQLTHFLTDIGQGAEAARLLQQRLSTMKVSTNGSWKAIEWFSVAAGIAASLDERGNADGAIAQYEFIERTLGKSPYAANATISRASLLAQSGRYSEALGAIEPLWVKWSHENREYKISGSERQFAWIRACALEGLGRHSEAEAAFRPVLQADETRDPHYFVESDKVLKLKGLVCMKRTDAVIDLLANQIQSDLGTEVLLLLQPAYRPSQNAAFWEKIRSDPKLMKPANERMHVLPVEMTPALNGWR